MKLRESLKVNMKSGQYYTEKEIKKFLCPTQSSTAEYLLADAICTGYLSEGISSVGFCGRMFRINN